MPPYNAPTRDSRASDESRGQLLSRVDYVTSTCFTASRCELMACYVVRFSCGSVWSVCCVYKQNNDTGEARHGRNSDG